MSDRCYMEVKSLPKHKKKFEDIGLTWQRTTKGVAEFLAEETDLSPEDLPMVPYLGWHGEGCEYGGERFACDGKTAGAAGVDKIGNIVIGFNEDTGLAYPKELSAARKFIQLEKRVRSMLDAAGGTAKRREKRVCESK